MNKLTMRDLTQIAFIAAVYVVLSVTPPLNSIAYGFAQFRLSEMLNFLPFYNKKYILAVTLGCIITNALGPNGPVDVIVGGGSTLIFVTLGVFLFERYMTQYIFNGKFNKAFFYFSIFFALSMFTIALELKWLGSANGQAFLLVWFFLFLGEFGSLLLGAFLVPKIAKYIDFTR